MDAASLRQARQELSELSGKPVTQHVLAKLLNMGHWGWQTVGKWERGEQAIPGPIELLSGKLLDEARARRAREREK